MPSNCLPAAAPILSGTYKPTNIGDGDTFISPAARRRLMLRPCRCSRGTNPNGDWKLFIFGRSGCRYRCSRRRMAAQLLVLRRRSSLQIELSGSAAVLSWESSFTGLHAGIFLERRCGHEFGRRLPGAARRWWVGRFVKSVNASSGTQFFFRLKKNPKTACAPPCMVVKVKISASPGVAKNWMSRPSLSGGERDGGQYC